MKKILLFVTIFMIAIFCVACDNEEESIDYGVLVERYNYILC